MTIAITGGTGFVGARLLLLAGMRGLPVQALARRAQPASENVIWVTGALDQPDALTRLVAGATCVIHVAGVVNAPSRQAFAAGNVAGTENMVRAAEQAGVRRFVHISSIAAREPELSDYGWSKHGAETPVIASGLDWSIVRPPAIYGPGERDMLDLFRAARRGIVPMPPGGRFSLIAADDLARLLLDMLDRRETFGQIYEPDDGHPGGWTNPQFAQAIGRAVGRKPLTLSFPATLMRAGAWLDGRIRGAGAKLTPDRVRYLCYPDWTVDPARRPPPSLWTPEIATEEGLVATARWYREAGWL